MHRQPGGGLRVRRPSENVQAQVVAHDAGEERRVYSAAVLRVHGVLVGRRLDRGPRRRPQRADARRLVQDLGDVTTLPEDRHAQGIVFEPRGAAAAIECG